MTHDSIGLEFHATYFALLDQSSIDPLGQREGESYIFDAFLERALKAPIPNFLDERSADGADDETYPVVAFKVQRASIDRKWQELLNTGDQWLKITVSSNSSDGSAMEFIGEDAPELQIRITNIEIASEADSIALDNLTKLPQEDDSDSFEREINPLFTKTKELQVSVVDVGQANLCALYEVGELVDFFYDLGWPTNGNLRTAPIKRPDIAKSAKPHAPVILSHWDWDHWGFAMEKISFKRQGGFSKINWHAPAFARPWIVPGVGADWGGVKIRPFHWRFALALTRKKAFHRWPSAVAEIYFELFSVHKTVQINGATGDSNQNGLVLVLDNAGGKQFPRTFIKSPAVLLTGDADYPSLPFLSRSSPAIEFNGIAATHHGAKFTVSSVPKVSDSGNSARLASSLGNPNDYGHPNPDALAAYLKAGWRHQAHTDHRVNHQYDDVARGNVGLSTSAHLKQDYCFLGCFNDLYPRQ